MLSIIGATANSSANQYGLIFA